MWSKETASIGVLLVGNAAVFSTVCCFYVICMILRLPKRLRAKLFARQLIYMAVFDIALAALSMYWVLRGGIFVHQSHSTPALHFAQGIWSFFEYASILVELHIALGIACSWARWEDGLWALDGSLCVTPVLALVCAIASVFDPHAKAEYVGIALIILTFASSGLAYGIALCAMRRSTHAAIRSIQRRLWFYPINFWLSFGFKFACDLNTDLFGTIVGVLAAFFLALNGFLNGATYFFHSRLHHGASRGVATQCVESGEVRLANIVSFHAIFPHDIEQVIEIGGSTFAGSVYAGSTFAGAPSMPLS